MLKDTTRIYGCFEKSGIYGYRFEDDNLTFDNSEWHGVYDSDKYGLPKSFHIVQQEKINGQNEIYCQDVLCISSYNGSIIYAYVEDSS